MVKVLPERRLILCLIDGNGADLLADLLCSLAMHHTPFYDVSLVNQQQHHHHQQTKSFHSVLEHVTLKSSRMFTNCGKVESRRVGAFERGCSRDTMMPTAQVLLSHSEQIMIFIRRFFFLI